MIDFTKETSQSMISTTSSNMSSSLINTNSRTSTFSSSSSESEPFNLKFITEDQKDFSKLMEDLSIIDNVYDTFEYDIESSSAYGKPYTKLCTKQLLISC